jgi:hypothetical protein
MTTRLDETPRRQQDRSRRIALRRADEPRNVDAPSREILTPAHGAHAGFDADLNPIDDEDINTHGSER